MASWSVTEQITQDNLSILKSILEDSEGSSSRPLLEKPRQFYNSCMRSNSETSLHDIIENVGGWNLTGAKIHLNDFDMRSKVLAVQRYTTSALFKW